MPLSGTSPLSPGKLRRKLTITNDTPVTTAAGYAANSVPVLTTWGSVAVKPTSPLIAAIAGQAMAQAQYVVTMRYPPSIIIAPGMRISDGRKTFRIHQVADVDERHHIMQLFCVEEPAQ